MSLTWHKALISFHSELIIHRFPTVQHSSVIGSNLTQLVSKLCCFPKQMIEEIWRRWTNSPATSKCIFLDIHFTFTNCQCTVRGERRDRLTPAGVLPFYGWQTVCLFLWQLEAPHRRLYSVDPLSFSLIPLLSLNGASIHNRSAQFLMGLKVIRHTVPPSWLTGFWHFINSYAITESLMRRKIFKTLLTGELMFLEGLEY